MKTSKLVALVGTLIAAAPATAFAQVEATYCSTDNYVCAGFALGDLSGGNLQLRLQNQGDNGIAGNQPAQLTGFALYNPNGTLTGTLDLTTSGFFNGTSLQSFASVGLDGLSAGAPPGLSSPTVGALELAYNFGKDALVPCGLGGTAGGGQTFVATCSGQYAVFNFTNIMGVTTEQALGVAVRFQSTGGEGSYKCFSLGPNGATRINGNDCVSLPGGGIDDSISSVPEPSTYALMASGLLGLVGVSARRRRQR